MRRLILLLAFLAALPAFAAPTHTCKSSNAGSGMSSLNCTLSSTAANHLLTAKLAVPAGAKGNLTISDTFGLAWSTAVSEQWNSAGNINILLWANTGAHTGNDTITVSWGASYLYTSLYAAEYSLNYAVDPNAAQAVERASASGSFTSNSIIVAQDNELLISIGDCNTSGANLTLNDVNWTVEDTNTNTCTKWADRALGAGTAGNAYTVAWSLSSSNTMTISTAAFGPITSPPTEPLAKCAKASAGTSASSYACALGTRGADQLLVIMTSGSQNDTVSITDTFSLSWSNITLNWSGSTFSSVLYYAVTGANSGSETVTISTSLASTYRTVLGAAYGGTPGWTGTVLDASGTYNNSTAIGSGTTFSASLTTTAAADLLVSLSSTGIGGSGTETITGSFIRQGWDAPTANSSSMNATEWATLTSAGAGSYSSIWRMNGPSGGPTYVGVILAAFKNNAPGTLTFRRLGSGVF